MKLHYYIITVIVLLLFGCDNDVTITEPEMPSVLSPLAIGNYWVLSYEEYDGNTLVYSTRDSIYIDSIVNWNGNEYYRIIELFDEVQAVNYTRNDVGGQYNLVIEEDTTEALALKYPAEVGDMWHTPWHRDWDPRDTIIVVSIDDDVTLAIGQFSGCQRMKYNNSRDEEGMWFQPGHGWVKSRWFHPHNGNRQIMDLVEYKVE